MTDKQLVNCARAFRKGILAPGGDPSMMCFAVCAPLSGLLAASGFPAHEETVDFNESAPCANHTWIRLEDGRILDPTADQFGLEAIYLGPVPELYLGWLA